MLHGLKNLALVRVILGLAGDLGLHVAAEGVENEAQRRRQRPIRTSDRGTQA